MALRKVRSVAAAVAVATLLTGSAPARERIVRIEIEHSRFAPDAIVVPAGSVVRFVIRNTDPIDHEFLLGDQAFQDRHERGTEPHHGARPGEISVPAGGTAETTYRFKDAGRLLFGCHIPGHWGYGMRGVVRVA